MFQKRHIVQKQRRAGFVTASIERKGLFIMTRGKQLLDLRKKSYPLAAMEIEGLHAPRWHELWGMGEKITQARRWNWSRVERVHYSRKVVGAI
jgi:hypothetical protein